MALTVDHVKVVLPVLNEARAKWYFIGQGLGCKDADLNEIQDTHLPNKTMCLQVMLRSRIQRGGLTLSMLCDTLRGEFVGRDDLAQNISALNLSSSTPSGGLW